MSKKLVYLVIATIFIICAGISISYAQSSSVPAPVMQSTPLSNPASKVVVPPQVKHTCPGNICNQRTPVQPNAYDTQGVMPVQGSQVKQPVQQNNNNCQGKICTEATNRMNQANPPYNQRPPQGNQGGNLRPIYPAPMKNQAPPPGYDQGPENILIIFDASYSMVDRLGNERKIDIAKRVVHNTLRQIPPDKRVGLRVYGHKIGFMGIYPCRKTELLVPIAFNTSNAIIDKLRKIEPTGQTPITYSLKTAIANDFLGLAGPKRIILVSDGMETCYGNPCDYAVELVRQGINMKIDVVGYALRDEAAINQLKCVALSTGGKFYSANTEAALADSLRNSFSVKTEVQGKIIFNK